MGEQSPSIWVLAAVLVLLVLSVVGAAERLSLYSSPETDLSLLTAQLHNVERGRGMLSYPGTLARYRPEHALYLQLGDRDGRSLAVWPTPMSERSWGPLAPLMQRARMWWLENISIQERHSLRTADGRLGELTVWRAGALAGLPAPFWGYLLGAFVSLVAAFKLIVRAPAAVTRQANRQAPVLVDDFDYIGPMADELNAAGSGVLVLDDQGLVMELNEVAQAWTGWSLTEAKGLPVTAVLKLIESESAVEVDPMAGLWHGLATLRRRQGEDRPVRALSIQLPDARIAWLLQDRTAEQAGLERLKSEATLAEKTLDYMGEGLAILDRYGRVIRANRRMYELFQYPPGQLLGLSLAKLMPVPFLHQPELTLEVFNGDAEAPKVVAWRSDASTFSADLRAHALGTLSQQWLILLRDSGERTLQENHARRLQTLLQAAPSGFFVMDSESHYVNEANPAAQSLLAKSLADLKRLRLRHLLPQLTVDEIAAVTEELAESDEPYREFRTELNVAGENRRFRLRLAWSAEEQPPVWLAYLQPLNSN